MNYQHAFHAGNFADVVKHTLLLKLIQALQQKDKGFCVLDTHAGEGLYRLDEGAALRTQEAEDGIQRLLSMPTPPAVLHDFLQLVRQFCLHPNAQRLHIYPGSPLWAAMLLRPQDRLILNELHPNAYASLREAMRPYQEHQKIAIHHMDAYQALKALLPPEPKRGLVLIDAPFEVVDEYERIIAGLKNAHQRFATGVYAIWYPIKTLTPVRAFHRQLQHLGFKSILDTQLFLRPIDNITLTGTGLTILNPPWQFDNTLQETLPALLKALGHGNTGKWQMEWLLKAE